MAIKNKQYCPIMKLTCDYFDICHHDGDYDFKKIKKVFKNLDLDYILLTQTKRRVIKQEFLTMAQVKFLIRKYKKLGLQVVVVRYKQKRGDNPNKKIDGAEVIFYKDKQCAYDQNLKGRNYIVVAANKADDIKRFISFENLYTKNPKACVGMGLYLGYPTCCVKKHFQNILKNGMFDEVSIDQRWDNDNNLSRYDCPLVNSPWPLFMHISCNNKCKQTYNIVRKVLNFCHNNIDKDFERWYFYYSRKLGSKTI